MRTNNKIILSFAVTLTFVNLILAFLGQNDLAIYFILNALAYLILAWFFMALDPRTRRAFNTMSLIISAGFLVVLAYKFVDILK